MTTSSLLHTKPADTALPAYASILLAIDSSDHSNRAAIEARAVAALYGAKITGAHVYAAKMHDMRFKQMEGGLPEQFRQEQELERQRDVHDDLINRGLSVITDSYLDQTEQLCSSDDTRFVRLSLEGKNYRALTQETNSGKYDLLVIGARGLGSIPGSQLGTVCRRVVRRANIDALVIKDPRSSVVDGPIVAAVDGSPHAYGGLITALALASKWQVPVKVVAAFDPYYHYVAFNRIADVLSEEAGKVFRFQEQEKLHEEIIDSGLAKIYQGHLTVSESIAAEYGMQVEGVLLDGKPHDAIEKYLDKINPSLLVVGKLGIHADPELDIGGNAESLLHNVKCAVLVSQRQHHPRVDVVADVTMSWTREAEQCMDNVPSFVRNMARIAIVRYAQERGHTVITERIVQDATAELMPRHAEQAMADIVAAHDSGELNPAEKTIRMRWSHDASALVNTVDDPSLRDNLRLRAEKNARSSGSSAVELDHIRTFMTEPASPVRDPQTSMFTPHWQAAALARLARVPEGFMRDAAKTRIEHHAQELGISEITLEIAEKVLARATEMMESARNGSHARNADAPRKCPFAALADGGAGTAEMLRKGIDDEQSVPTSPNLSWTKAALAQLDRVPVGYCRDMTVKAAETIAHQQELKEIDAPFVTQLMEIFKSGSDAVAEELPWDDAARERIERAPPMVRGMLVREVEGWVQRHNMKRVNIAAVDAVKSAWQTQGAFHLDPDDPRSH